MTTTPRAIVLALLLAASPVAAQTPAAPTAAPGNAPPTPPADYQYSAAGRRDPFVPAVSRGPVVVSNPRAKRPLGIAGLMVDEVVVRGILQSQGLWVAMVRATDGRTYTVRTGDHLMDGTVGAITADAVVLLQDVKDPLSTAKQREVRKFLRGGEEAQ